ncbi:hypothetical protein EK21DRAFT_113887 [Setomelanomma holmii]|uniref:Uncharacterized protein n=1 Tax=Setomelanomma holmii TaxID=210430 RepID=A0A9P4H5A9_9PLEO|nr:hypothetical protein EK21DRAFT_113887 [Setomelanomma holmii]
MCWDEQYEDYDAIDAFEEQAPELCAVGPHSVIPPPRANSVRSDAYLPPSSDDILESYFALHPVSGDQLESVTLLDAYGHGLSLGSEPRASAFRDTLVDAMAEVMDDYGLEGMLQHLFDTTKERPACPMWRLFAFQYVLNKMPCAFGERTRVSDNDQYETC